MRLLLSKVAIVLLVFASCEESCEARAHTWKRSIGTQPAQIDEIQIHGAHWQPNEVPLVAELLSNPENSPQNNEEFSVHPDISPTIPVNFPQRPDSDTKEIHRKSPENNEDFSVHSDISPLNPDISPTIPGNFPQSPDSKTMVNTVVFRPLFPYRKQNVERRSLSSRRQSKRGEEPSAGGGGYNNYFSNPPPYLVYNRKTGAYFPYYNYPNYNKNVRRS